MSNIDIKKIKEIGGERTDKSLDLLFKLYYSDLDISLKREVVSSIGRHSDKKRVLEFLKQESLVAENMELVYQFYRTALYNTKNEEFNKLRKTIENYYDNEMIYKMKQYYFRKHNDENNLEYIYLRQGKYSAPLLLEGDSTQTLKGVYEKSVDLIFTSPPYYNAREYSNYCSYKMYLEKMKTIMQECFRVLQDGRFIVINISPVISRRPGREFGNIRYPLHFDFHLILKEIGFDFVDEIIWIKQEPAVPRRIGGYLQVKKPLTYKPNVITESLLVYRKDVGFLVDENLLRYENGKINFNDTKENIFTTNCWQIPPSSKKNHPAVFPEKLCENVLKYYSFKGDIILDPFAGSGTLGKVAIQMQRIPILCESNSEYMNDIKKILKKLEVKHE